MSNNTNGPNNQSVEPITELLASIGYELKTAIKDHRKVTRYEHPKLQNISLDLAAQLHKLLVAERIDEHNIIRWCPDEAKFIENQAERIAQLTQGD